MPIIGINFTSITAKTEDKIVDGNINVNSTPTIKNVSKKKIPIFDADDVLAIEFNFVIDYDPKIGEIVFEGDVLYKTSKAESILKSWKKEKKLDDEVTLDVLNGLLRRCMTRAIDIAMELRLPPPVRFPTVTKKE